MEIFTLNTPLDRDRTFIATSVLKPSMLEKVKMHLHVIKTHCSAQSGSLPTNHPVSLLVEMRTSPAKACICILLSVLKNKVVTQKMLGSPQSTRLHPVISHLLSPNTVSFSLCAPFWLANANVHHFPHDSMMC